MKFLSLSALAIFALFSLKIFAGGGIQPIDNDAPILLDEPVSQPIEIIETTVSEPSYSSDPSTSSNSSSTSSTGSTASNSNNSNNSASSSAASYGASSNASNAPVSDANTLVVTPETTQAEIDQAVAQGKTIIHMGVYDRNEDPVLDGNGNPVISPVWKSRNQ